MNIERLKDWNITNPKSGIQRSVFGIGLQQSKSYLRLLQCVTPLVKFLHMWAHVHPEERRSPEWVPLILWFLWRDFSWGMALYQQAAQQEERGTPSSRASASPSPKPQCWAQLSSALLSSAPLCPSHPGTATGSCPLESGIPAHPCVYWELSTQITPLLFIWFYGIGLEVSSLGRSKSDLSSPGIPFWACSGIWIVTLH